MAVKLPALQSENVWLAAAVAWRINDCKYFKHTNYVTKENDNGSYDTVVDHISNASIMMHILDRTYKLIDLPYEPDVEYVVTEDDKTLAQTVREYWGGQMIKILSNTANAYEMVVIKAATTDETTTRKDIAIIASSFVGYARNKERDNVNKVKIDADSQHLPGNVGDKVELDLLVLTSRFVDSVGRHITDAITIDTKNLVSWWGNKHDVGETISITGKIKSFGDDFFTKVPSTQINYVKVKNNEEKVV